MKKLFKIKYPKLTFLVLAVFLAYLLFRNPLIGNFVFSLGSLRYFGIFIAGFLFSFGFTTPFSIGFFVTYPAQNLILASIVAGLGSTLSTILLLKWFKFSFRNEIYDLEKTSTFKYFVSLIDRSFSHKIKIYLTYIFFGIIIASPLPNEFMTFIMAGMPKVRTWVVAILTFILTSIGIYVILLLSG